MAFLGAIGLGVLGVAAYETSWLFAPRYPRTALDDLLGKLPSRENANRFGKAALAENRTFSVAETSLALRKRLDGKSLAAAMEDDLVQDRTTQVDGWVMPETLTILCALSAKLS